MATPTLVQHKGGGGTDNNTGVNNAVYFLENPTLSGNCIVLALSWTDTDGTLSSITDDGGNTWSTTAANTVVSATNVRSSQFLLLNCNANTKSIKVTYSALVGNFTMQATEIANIATSGALNGTVAAADVAAPNLACGSFTPTVNNDANGGNFIIAYFRCSKLGSNSSAADHFTAGSGFSLLDGDNINSPDGTIFRQHANEYFVQATQAAINPSLTANSQSASDSYNCLAIALKAASAGTTYNSTNGIHVRKILHYTSLFPATGTVKLTSPSEGNLRVLQISQSQAIIVITSVTDSDGKSYVPIPNTTADTWLFYAENCTPNNALTFTVTTSGGTANETSTRFFDVEFAAQTNVLASHADNIVTVGTNLRADDDPIHTPLFAGSLIIACGPTNGGPIKNNFDPAAINPTPAAAIFNLINYDGETDNDTLDNADACAHYYAPNTNTIHWNWVTGVNGTTVAVVSAEFKTAPAVVLWTPHFIGFTQPITIKSFLGIRFNQASDLSGPLPTQPETNIHLKGKSVAPAMTLLSLIRQNPANDVPAAAQIEAEPHFIGKAAPSSIFLLPNLRQNTANDTSLPTTQPETNVSFVGKSLAPSIKLPRLAFQNQANDPPAQPLFDQPPHFVGKFSASVVSLFRGLRENPATDVIVPFETNTHFVGKVSPQINQLLALLRQNAATDLPALANVHFTGKFIATIVNLLRSLRENQASDPTFLPTQPETNPHFVGRFTLPQIELLALLRQNQALDFFRQIVINPNFISTGLARRMVIAGLSRRQAAGAPRRRIVVGISNNVAQASDLVPPIDAVVEVEAATFDFGLILNPTARIQSIVSVTCSVDQIQVDGVTDPAPQSRLIGPALIGPSPNSGIASQAVLQLVGTMIGGVLYRLQCVVLTTDGQEISLWNHLLCQTLN